MRIILDLQACQGGNKDRGIGRYSMSLAKGIARNAGGHEICVLLNGGMSDSVLPIRRELEGLIPKGRIFVFNAPKPSAYAEPDNSRRTAAAELIREHALFSLKPDIIHIMSMFEGYGDEATSSAGLIKGMPVSLTMYDLIPLMHKDAYLSNLRHKEWYYRKLQHVKNSQLILAISEHSRKEAVDALDLEEAAAVNISAAVDGHFRPVKFLEDESVKVLRRHKIEKDFAMYTGGINYRKNIEGLIRAFAKLPGGSRRAHQLVIVCSISADEKLVLERLVKKEGLKTNDVVFTGFVDDGDLTALYNLCKVFVFPSLHEGFGLPALEAMACGAAVIGSGVTSIPEVIGRQDALFDPYSDGSVSSKLNEALTDGGFRRELKEHGLNRAKLFSWDKSAKIAVEAFEVLHKKIKKSEKSAVYFSRYRPRLAFVSPLPPEQSGISYYGAELLPELSKYYEIEIIVEQKEISDDWAKSNYPARSAGWFREHSRDFDRVLYHFGNSEFHAHMFKLLEEIPGVAVLHDFFLSGISAHMEINGYIPNCWAKELYFSHGYKAVKERFHAEDTADVVLAYPCNLGVLRQAKGVIAHSEYSRGLADKFYGENSSDGWHIILHLRVAPQNTVSADKTGGRKSLGLNDEDFIICSFGIMGQTKLNRRLLDAFLSSSLVKDKRCKLIFAGKNDEGDYGKSISKKIKESGIKERIIITGWTDADTFRKYLAAADLAVQLRAFSRGETSGTVLDCMNYGLPVIVNANGFMAELPKDCVFMLPDEFSDGELLKSLENLWKDAQGRMELGKKASDYIRRAHSPRKCAERYAEALEEIYGRPDGSSLVRAIAEKSGDGISCDKEALLDIAKSVAASVAVGPVKRRLLLDVSELVRKDWESGIQRVVKGVLSELLNDPPPGYYVEPVYAGMEHGYRYARQFTMNFLDCPGNILSDEPVEYGAGDVFFGLDLQPHIVARHKDFYMELRRRGASVFFMVHDILPVLMPQYFFPDAKADFERWLDAVSAADGAVCVSRATAGSLAEWLRANRPDVAERFKIAWNHNGYDTGVSAIPGGMPEGSGDVLDAAASRYSFLMVGTLEPRKGHLQALDAFELLWERGIDINLVIVGKLGWLAEDLSERINGHSELNKRLFLLEGISDEYLEKVYGKSICLIAASEGEGFGLPLIEAARHKLPIIARDIPVFREVAGGRAFYFAGGEAENIAKAVEDWLELYKEGRHPKSDDMPRLTWKESVRGLLKVILPEQPQ